MNKLNTPRFAMWVVLVSLGWLSFFWLDDLGLLFFFAAYFIATPRDQLRRVVSGRELSWMACVLAALIVIMLALKVFVSAAAEKNLERLFKNPVIIITLWLLCLGLGFLAWRKRGENTRLF